MTGVARTMTDRDLGHDLDVDALVARGLARYRAGDVDGALTAWEHVLAIDPGEPRALGYVDYVRQNYDELVGREAPMAEMLIPFGLGRGDDDDYEISISRDDAPPLERAPEPSIDDGWGLDADQQPSWLDRAAMVATEIELEADEPSEEESGRRPTAPLGQGGFEDERTRDFLDARRAQLLPFDFGPEPSQGGEPTLSRLPVAPASEPTAESTADVPVPPAIEESGDSTLDFGLARSDFGPDFTGERTMERSAARLAPEVLRSLGIAPPGERPATSDEETRQHWPRATDLELAPGAPHDPASELAIEPLEALPEPDRNDRFAGFAEAGTVELKRRSAADDDRNPVEVEDLLLPPPGASTSPVDDDTGDTAGGRHRPLPVEEALTAGLSAVIDEGASPTEAPDERARRRISALLERAQVASRADEHAVAVAAIDLALSEAPDLASAQKLVHRSRDAILDCYYRFFGDLARRPQVVESYDALTRRALDPRAAFLLSRIDGTLSFEDILDVAGMGRLEACRHLAHLLWRGIIEARPTAD